MTDLEIIKLEQSHVPEIVDVHLNAFNGFFLTSLGKAFLRKYYSAVIAHPDSICLGCKIENGPLAGFAVGNKLSKGFHLKILRANWLMFFLEGIRLAAVKPKAILRLFRNLSKNEHPTDDGLYAELLSIGVAGSSEGMGIGRKLIEQFQLAAIQSGASRISLTTDKLNNERTVKFYLNTGYSVYYEFTTYPNRLMYKLIKEI